MTTLTCATCGLGFPRECVRGRTPIRCPACQRTRERDRKRLWWREQWAKGCAAILARRGVRR
jgi:hypothetical protein